MSRLFIPLLLALSFVFAFAAGAEEADSKRTVRVTGTGVATALPDMAGISIGVVSEGPSAAKALENNTAAMSRVIEQLKEQKVAPKDIQTTNFTVRPKFQHSKDGKPPVIAGYRVVNSVRIVVRDLKRLGAIVDQAVGAGSNEINGIEFSIDDTGALEDAARKKAMADARHKAELYAGAGKTQLGKVISISEDFVSPPPRPVFGRVAMEAKAAPVPVEPGEHKVQARVHVTWELKN